MNDVHVSNIEEYLKLDVIDDPEWRQKVHAEFPQVVVAGAVPKFDVAVRWCWECFGPQHGACWAHSYYPACPNVLATLHSRVITAFGQNDALHSHKGDWTILWLGKTDYDFGGEFRS